MNTDYQSLVKCYALAEAPRECCGYILAQGDRFEVRPCHNVSQFPEAYFQMDAAEFLGIKTHYKIHAVYHSHPTTSVEFSEADKRVAEETLIPILVYSIPDDAFAYYTPTGHCAPVEGRLFVPLVFDCVNLVRDYLKQETGVNIGDLRRDLSTIQLGTDQMKAYCETNGFEIVTGHPLKKYDIVVMQLGRVELPNHVAVYIGGGQIIHQVIHRASTTDVYGGYWEKHTVAILRNKVISGKETKQ